MSTTTPQPSETALPQWISPSINRKAGRDPLGLQTITEDRIMPALLPGVLTLSRRARYFSFYPFLLDEYARARGRASNAALDLFVRRREFEYAVAVHLCPHGCGQIASAANGALEARAALRGGSPEIERRESVESTLGGYGLYYRSPLIELGVVASMGTLLGEGDDAAPTPVDVLTKDGRGEMLAARFRDAVNETTYYQQHFARTDPIPREVLEEYATACCLCRLGDFPDERKAIHDLLFSAPNESQRAGTEQRRRSFAIFLQAVDDDSRAAQNDGAFRETLVRLFDRSDTLPAAAAFPAAQWAALTKKEYAQDALSVIWADFISRGLAESGEGFTTAELKVFLRQRLAESIVFPIGQGVPIEPTTPTHRTLEFLREQAASLSEEEIRQAAISAATAPAGLAALLLTLDRVPKEPPDAFVQVGGANGEHQPGLLLLRHEVDVHLEGEPTIADTIEWVCRRFIISAHEQIAWPKMPDFTFRFCWESGRLAFYDNGIYRFELAGNRRDAMSRISRDLGLWDGDESDPSLTLDGRAFLAEVTA